MRRAKWEVGALVKVPYYCFSPYRKGWNGWLFADGVVVERRVGVGKNEGKRYSVVEYTVNGETQRKQFCVENVFER